MNASTGITIDPTVLADIGKGDASAGAARLRLAISDLRERKHVGGPTPRPPSVRVAIRSDEPALEELLAMEASEVGIAVAPVSLDDIQDMVRMATREVGRGVIGIIEGPEGGLVGATGLFPAKWWWSSAWYLLEQFTFVHPEHRKSRHAKDLVLFSRYAADKMTVDMGYPVYLLHGITATSDADRKVRLLQRLSNYVGSFFLYPWPDGLEDK